jgi:hypothetical protein
VLALDADHQVVGQASALSTLTVDDGTAPGGSTVLSFAAAGADSVAALRTAAGGTEIRHYATATGTYGAVIASDADSDADYEVLGASADRTLLVHQSAPGGDIRVETWDTTTDTLLGATELPVADYTFLLGRVDEVHNTGALLLRSVGTASGLPANSDLVLPVDLTDGSTGAPIPADPAGVAAGTYSLLDFDTSTGAVYLAKTPSSAICYTSATTARVDLTARTATAAGSSSACSHGFVSDDQGTLYNLSVTSISLNLVPSAVLTPLDAATGTKSPSITLRSGVPAALAVDGTHKIAVVSYASPPGKSYYGSSQPLVLDNNATSQLAVVDLTSGAIVRTLSGFDVTSRGGSLLRGGQGNSIQLDPATRTGWTYSPYGDQVQQFTY